MIDIFLGGAGNSTTVEGEGEKTKYFYVVEGQ
jgi:V-type ATPase 116kDa subunit family